MKNQLFALLSIVMSGLMASCYFPPQDPQNTSDIVADEQKVITDAQNAELQQARENLQNKQNELNGRTASVASPVIKSAYPTASSVPGKPGFVLNPYTGNQVDARGVPSRSLIRDPNDPDATHKFRVP